MTNTNNIDIGRRRSEQQNHQRQYTQECKKQYSVKKGAGYGAFGGFIAAVSFTGIMLWMSTIFNFPVGTFIHTLGTSTSQGMSD